MPEPLCYWTCVRCNGEWAQPEPPARCGCGSTVFVPLADKRHGEPWQRIGATLRRMQDECEVIRRALRAGGHRCEARLAAYTGQIDAAAGKCLQVLLTTTEPTRRRTPRWPPAASAGRTLPGGRGATPERADDLRAVGGGRGP